MISNLKRHSCLCVAILSLVSCNSDSPSPKHSPSTTDHWPQPTISVCPATPSEDAPEALLTEQIRISRGGYLKIFDANERLQEAKLLTSCHIQGQQLEVEIIKLGNEITMTGEELLPWPALETSERGSEIVCQIYLRLKNDIGSTYTVGPVVVEPLFIFSTRK